MRVIHDLQTWASISSRFKSTLILGNGASIAVDKRFSYKRLYEEVVAYSALNEELLGMFKEHETSNFEFILRLLSETNRVNRILGIQETKTNKYYLQLRDALITTIRSIHPQHEEVAGRFEKIGQFLHGFGTVLSLNYDLLVYWAILAWNEKHGKKWFKDCFLDGEFERDFGRLRGGYGDARGATLVFYPHGSLFLATEPFGGDAKKVTATEQDYLLESVLRKWEADDYLPLFVSEGTSAEKLRAIRRNSYLNRVFDAVMSKPPYSLAIYGWSLSDQDEHIVKALGHGSLSEIAVSIHKGDSGWQVHRDEVVAKLAALPGSDRYRVIFFDSESPGCWIH